MNIKIFSLFAVFGVLFTACATPTKHSINKINLLSKQKTEKKPYWTDPKANLGSQVVVGYAKAVFQGMYMQQQNAINDAKIKLSHKINSTISAKTTNKTVLFGKEINTKFVKDIKAFNKLIINDLKQYDAYIDKDGNLYLLMGITDSYKQDLVTKKKLHPYDSKKLTDSKCYDKETLLSIATKAPVYKDKPIWFYQPLNSRYYTSIGIAQQNTKTFQKQKEMAILLAKSNMMKKIKSISSSKLKLLEVTKNEESATLYDVSALHKSTAKINSIKVQDIWMDPKTCELYVLIYSER